MNKIKRVLHFFGAMDRGGAETMIMNVYRNINRDKVQFDFAVHTDKKCHYDDEILSLGGRIIKLPVPKGGLRSYNQTLDQLLKQATQYQVVHSHLHYFSGNILKVAKINKVPIRIAHSHTTKDGVENNIMRMIYRLLMKRQIKNNSTHMFGCSKKASEALFGVNCWKNNYIKVIKNGIDISSFIRTNELDKVKEELNISKDSRPVIGHVGRFAKPKNHTFIIEIFCEILKKKPNALLLLVGEGALKYQIESMVKQRQILDNVRFLGIREDIPKLMLIFDVLLFPSIYEGLPVVLVEAQAAGIPCVISSTITNEVDLDLGLLQFVELGCDIETWVDKIDNSIVLDKPSESFIINAINERGYNIQKVAKELEMIYLNGAYT